MTIEVKNNNIQALEEELLEQVNGGNCITDAWEATCNWAEENKGILVRGACLVGGIALCATGIGAAAGLGLVAVESVTAVGIIATGFGSLGGAAAGAIITEGWEE